MSQDTPGVSNSRLGAPDRPHPLDDDISLTSPHNVASLCRVLTEIERITEAMARVETVRPTSLLNNQTFHGSD